MKMNDNKIISLSILKLMVVKNRATCIFIHRFNGELFCFIKFYPWFIIEPFKMVKVVVCLQLEMYAHIIYIKQHL